MLILQLDFQWLVSSMALPPAFLNEVIEILAEAASMFFGFFYPSLLRSTLLISEGRFDSVFECLSSWFSI